MARFRNPAVLLSLVVAALCACNTRVNAPIVVNDGETHSGGLSTVNGTITIGSGCTVEGGCRSLNGAIRVGDRSRVEGVSAVNGQIRVGEGAVIDGDIEAVNGSVSLGAATEVSGEVSGAPLPEPIDLLPVRAPRASRLTLPRMRIRTNTA